MEEEGQEEEVPRFMVSRPIAYKPSFSPFGFFSGLLGGTVDDSSSPCSFSGATAVAVQPMMAPSNPSLCCPSGDNVSAQIQEGGSNVYKPLAKLARTTFSLQSATDSGNFGQETPPPPPPSNSSQAPIQTKLISPVKALHGITYTATLPAVGQSIDSPTFDGYDWRKYGQKQVKGSEYPRSYYKCTSPNCPVKKMVEMTLDGQIAEIVYKGEHNHSKPPPPKRDHELIHSSEGEDKDRPFKNNEGIDGKLVKQNHSCSILGRNKEGKEAPFLDQLGVENRVTASLEDSSGRNCEFPEVNGAQDESDQPISKRRRMEKDINEGSAKMQALAQSSADSEILEDGFRWRKYGQKVIKGNPYPRSYYRCTGVNCNVRKLVERSLAEPSAFITTYEGKHNHERPGNSESRSLYS